MSPERQKGSTFMDTKFMAMECRQLLARKRMFPVGEVLIRVLYGKVLLVKGYLQVSC